MKLPFFALALCGVITLSACTFDQARPQNVAHLPKTDAIWQTHLQKIAQIQSYSAQGQLGYISAKERFSSRFDWKYQNPQNYSLKLYSLLSKSTLNIDMRPSGLTLSDENGNRQTAQNAQLLLREIVGMDLPFDYFGTWLKGQPLANSDYQVGLNHLLASFQYPINGEIWTADYLAFHANQLPQSILLKNQSQQQTLKIRLDEWKF